MKTEYDIAILVQAETPQLAREVASSQLTALCIDQPHAVSSWGLTFLPPVRANSDEGAEIIMNLWTQCLEDWLSCVDVMDNLLKEYDRPKWVEFILEDWYARSASLRFGDLYGHPIRIYFNGMGINNGDVLKEITVRENMWAVQAVVE